MSGMFWASNVVFCSTGVIAVLLIQWEDYHGLGGPTTMLTTLPIFLGQMLVCAPTLFVDHHPRRIYEHRFWLVALVNLAGEALCQFCIIKAGSGLFTVLYSSVTVWAALMKWQVVGVRPTVMQWAALVVITIGLALSAWDSLTSNTSKELGEVILGISTGIAGAVFYGAFYVLSDVVLKGEGDGLEPPPSVMSAFVGMLNTVLLAVYILLYDGPRWAENVSKEVDTDGGSFYAIVLVYILLTLTQGLHFVSFFYVAKDSGAVAAGVNKAVQASSIFVLSSVFYCHEDTSQCFSPTKGMAVACVVLGVLLYAKGAPVPLQDVGASLAEDEDGTGEASLYAVLTSEKRESENNR